MMTGAGMVLSGSLLLHGIVPSQATDLEKIDHAARAFAEREDIQALVDDNRPRLAAVYPLVVRDYFSNAGREELLPEPRPAHVRECARHYETFWLERRFIWPTEADGSPDWATIYVQALDHYLGFCLRWPRRQ
ncbi:MAG: hypothetical protein U5P41_01260 [Gammaproteobacteria bacterium]|nr:hypothetical protein [Gammaproteobacteria bacterium]